jgi:hypothetical protein
MVDWDWWRSPVIAASVWSDLLDILRQGAEILAGAAVMHTCRICGVLLVKESDPFLAWGQSERRI